MMTITLDQPAGAAGWTLPPAAATPEAPILPAALESAADRAVALNALINTNESMRHRAADVGLNDIVDICALVSDQLAQLRAGTLPLTPARIGMLRHTSAVLAAQLDAQFDQRPLDGAALDGDRKSVV